MMVLSSATTAIIISLFAFGLLSAKTRYHARERSRLIDDRAFWTARYEDGAKIIKELQQTNEHLRKSVRDATEAQLEAEEEKEQLRRDLNALLRALRAKLDEYKSIA